jgi:TonB-linked SusC/RagA family outer membrane protein
MMKYFTGTRVSVLWIFICSPLLTYAVHPGSAEKVETSHSILATTFIQANAIRGTVVDETGAGLPGVNIVVKGTSSGTTSDADGKYVLNLPAGFTDGTLVYSFIGFATQEQPVNGKSIIDVTLVPDVQALSEVVVVGYGVQEKRDVTGSISSINSDAISKIANTNTLEGMKGQIAGVDVLQSNGRPGTNPTITIRGRRSINASNDPLFVIDGVPMTSGTSTDTDANLSSRTPPLPGGTAQTSGSNPLNDFNPADIASIEVLKDAAATAIYGSRGANGVVLITTKRGKSGKTTVNYSGYYGVTQPFSRFPMMNGEDFANLKREAYRLNSAGRISRDAWNGTISPDEVVFGGQPVELKSVQEGRSTDWQDLIFQDGSQVNHQISATGGSDKTQFNMSLGYFKQNGTIEGLDFTKVTARINVDQQISKRFKAGMSNQFTHSIQNNGSPAVMSESVNQSPLGVPYDDQGNLIFLPISDAIRSNPLNEIVPGKMIDEEKIDRIFSSAYLEADIIKGLKYKFLIGADLRYTTRGIFEGRFTNSRKNGDPAAQFQGQSNIGYTMENLLTYNKVLNEKHNLGLTFLQSIQESNYENKYTSVSGLPYETQKWYNLNTASTIIANRSRYEHWSLASFMGRINYTFNGKYMLQATMRADGSSRLAPGKKWTTFPGVSAGWRIKEENFMSNINVISDLKLRASYGVVGNTSIDPYKTQGVLQRSLYSWDEANAAGFALSELPNPDLGWEKNATVDIGLDFGLFNGRLSGTVDVYQTNTTDLLLRRNLPPGSGYDFIFQNVGATRTRGIEVTLSANIITSTSGFKWDADFNIAHYKEEIVDLALRDPSGNKSNDTGNSWFIGEPVRVFYDYKKIGIWQADEADLATSMMNAFPGEIKLQDTDGNGLITPNDRVVIGNDIPTAYGGLNNRLSFKGFDFSFFLYYRLGYTLDSRFHSDQASMQSRYNNLDIDYWTIDNPTNDYPRPNFNQENPAYNTTLRYKDGGFVKLRTVTLGYSLPQSICDKLAISSLRLYVSAQNPKVWSSYKVFDPESVDRIDAGDVPSNKVFLGGINLTF